MWRGDLSPLGCAATPKAVNSTCLTHPSYRFRAASQPSGDKSPRHRILCAVSHCGQGTHSDQQISACRDASCQPSCGATSSGASC
ncbi:hypothetical protein C0J56_05355 [Pseudomonas fluorescens]|nr:hypothetical protein C0J56_05355 [Pseudomonas fluorescens]